MRKSRGIATIETGLKVKFENEIKSYTRQLEAFVSGESQNVFGSIIEPKMPKENINDILAKYTKLGKEQLQQDGVRAQRAQSVSAHVFAELLNAIMNEIEVSKS